MAFVINVIKWLMCMYWAEFIILFWCKHLSTLPANTTVTLAQYQTSTGSTLRVCWAAFKAAGLVLRLQADTDPMSVKCWASVDGGVQYPFGPSQYFILPVPACWQYGTML